MINRPRRDGQIVALPVAANVEIKEGAIVALTATGYAVAATHADAARIVGRANNAAYNLGGVDGEETVNVQRKNAFLFANADGADTVTVAHLFTTGYLVDDYTVAAVEGTPARLPVGTIIEVSKEGVWVEIA